MTTLRYVRRWSQARLSLKSRSTIYQNSSGRSRTRARVISYRRRHLPRARPGQAALLPAPEHCAPQGLHPVPTVVKEPWGLPFHRRAAAAIHAGSKHPIVEVRGFEPLTYGLQSHRSSQLSYTPRQTIRETNSTTSSTGEADLPDFSSFSKNKKGRSEMGRAAEAAAPRSNAPPEGESLRDKSVHRV